MTRITITLEQLSIPKSYGLQSIIKSWRYFNRTKEIVRSETFETYTRKITYLTEPQSYPLTHDSTFLQQYTP